MLIEAALVDGNPAWFGYIPQLDNASAYPKPHICPYTQTDPYKEGRNPKQETARRQTGPCCGWTATPPPQLQPQQTRSQPQPEISFAPPEPLNPEERLRPFEKAVGGSLKLTCVFGIAMMVHVYRSMYEPEAHCCSPSRVYCGIS